MQGANLAVIDAHELTVQAAWISGILSRPTKGRPKNPDKYFDAKAARKQVLEGGKPKKATDFTNYERMKEGLKGFDWQAHYVPKQTKSKK